MDQISQYRQVIVNIYPSESMGRVVVLCRDVHRGDRRDARITPPSGVELTIGAADTVADVFRAAGRALGALADSL